MFETQIIASTFSDEVGTVTSGSRLRWSFDYFSEQTNNFNIAKVNYLENTIMYINQAYLTIKNNKKMFYADHQILGQIIEVLNPPEDVSSYAFKERKVKLVRPRYELSTSEFLCLYNTIGCLIVRRDGKEHLLNYRHNDNKSKLLYSFYK